ncbi:Holliday junction branch migration protein RuvA [Candidatus Liberibacter americanus]|uniref:Holliday junction branch migration complex subunit RuvA n=1 Tax=Candidatus Liberibacter americanus str. Sao Paulo TaxID=1261131 RepID=U6B8T2_9HYPH|nr:Holliday junction branch migration protein RuvA [Candidatus Liberibacter americanus]AHA28162.1 Holliday junction resolvasome DNA-binding subunit [Candidatus Liberibacter americanus str. Sao Paulo]EMS35926.1 Holliday junction DNA helicase RuvA [Candidatus Liberibacter americanus PW_SP]
MIGKIKGNIDELYDDYVLIDVKGVCYIIHCPMRTLSNIGELGDSCILFIETHFRQDQIKLYGFLSDLDRKWFVLLQNVQGIGARVAISILSHMAPSELVDSIILQDNKVLAKIPGIGLKVASRIITELKDKAISLSSYSQGQIINSNGDKNSNLDSISSVANNAISALVNLGYSRDQATIAVSAVIKREKNITCDGQIIKLALKEVSC